MDFSSSIIETKQNNIGHWIYINKEQYDVLHKKCMKNKSMTCMIKYNDDKLKLHLVSDRYPLLGFWFRTSGKNTTLTFNVSVRLIKSVTMFYEHC